MLQIQEVAKLGCETVFCWQGPLSFWMYFLVRVNGPNRTCQPLPGPHKKSLSPSSWGFHRASFCRPSDSSHSQTSRAQPYCDHTLCLPLSVQPFQWTIQCRSCYSNLYPYLQCIALSPTSPPSDYTPTF